MNPHQVVMCRGFLHFLQENSRVNEAKLSVCISLMPIGRVELQDHSFFTSELDGDKWSASRYGRLSLVNRFHLTHRKDGWINLRAGKKFCRREKFLASAEDCNRNTRTSSPLPIILTELFPLLANGRVQLLNRPRRRVFI